MSKLMKLMAPKFASIERSHLNKKMKAAAAEVGGKNESFSKDESKQAPALALYHSLGRYQMITSAEYRREALNRKTAACLMLYGKLGMSDQQVDQFVDLIISSTIYEMKAEAAVRNGE